MTVTQPRLSDIQALAAHHALDLLGGFHPNADDKTPETCKTLLMLGPAADFWTHINTSPEMKDGQPDPIDRWSTRVTNEIAKEINAEAAFPFGGPPYQPFYSWALRTARVWSSPVMFAVHDTQGLFVSFRSALLLPYRIDLPATPDQAPCEACAKPCLTACPVGALTQDGYDVDKCHAYLDTPEGADCMSKGCAVRRVCPVGQDLRKPEQSAYHMSLFHKS